MKAEDIRDVFDGVEDDLILEAAPDLPTKKSKTAVIVLAIAAALLLAALIPAGILLIKKPWKKSDAPNEGSSEQLIGSMVSPTYSGETSSSKSAGQTDLPDTPSNSADAKTPFTIEYFDADHYESYVWDPFYPLAGPGILEEIQRLGLGDTAPRKRTCTINGVTYELYYVDTGFDYYAQRVFDCYRDAKEEIQINYWNQSDVVCSFYDPNAINQTAPSLEDAETVIPQKADRIASAFIDIDDYQKTVEIENYPKDLLITYRIYAGDIELCELCMWFNGCGDLIRFWFYGPDRYYGRSIPFVNAEEIQKEIAEMVKDKQLSSDYRLVRQMLTLSRENEWIVISEVSSGTVKYVVTKVFGAEDAA